MSLEWIDPHITSSSLILDLSEVSAFTDVLNKCTTATVRAGVVPDLRYTFPLRDCSFDMALCMETIEHICDRGDSRLDIFTGSGINNMMRETYRVLRTGGHLLISTPNVCCYNSIWNILKGEHPFSYPSHFREMTLQNVIDYVTEAGFSIVKYEVVSVWDDRNVPEDVINKIDAISRDLGLEVERGDCIFVLARK